MRHDWIADILAVIDSGSFARAAELRNITQSAFTRRIDAIEAQLGGPALRPAAQARGASARRTDARTQPARGHAGPVRPFAGGGGSGLGQRVDQRWPASNAISATVSPGIVRALSGAGLEPVRIRSGNRDECLVMLLSGAADLVISYAVRDTGPETGGIRGNAASGTTV